MRLHFRTLPPVAIIAISIFDRKFIGHCPATMAFVDIRYTNPSTLTNAKYKIFAFISNFRKYLCRVAMASPIVLKGLSVTNYYRPIHVLHYLMMAEVQQWTRRMLI